MKILVLIVSLLLALPCMAGTFPGHDRGLQVASNDRPKKEKPSGGKVIIRGKGGKVTDVKKPKGDKKKKK